MTGYFGFPETFGRKRRLKLYFSGTPDKFYFLPAIYLRGFGRGLEICFSWAWWTISIYYN